MNTKEAILKIISELKSDTGYRQGWVANIAMSYIDTEHSYKKRTGKNRLNRQDAHIVANESAEHFINILCNEPK